MAERVSDDDAARSAARRFPASQALPAGHSRVHDRDRHRESFAESSDELRGEPDLRHQDERLLPSGARADETVDHGKVDLGLAAPGHSVEKEGAKRPGRGRNGVDCAHLRLVRGRELRCDTGGRRGGREPFYPPLPRQGPHGRAPVRNRGEPGLVEARLPAFPGHFLEGGDHRRLPRRAGEIAAAGGRTGEAPGVHRGGRRAGAAQADREGGPDHVADRMMVVVRRPGEQTQEGRRDRRLLVEPLRHFAQPAELDFRFVRGFENHAGPHRAAERDLHPHAGHEPWGVAARRLGRRQILEPAAERARYRDSENARHGRPVSKDRESSADGSEMDSRHGSLRSHRQGSDFPGAASRRARSSEMRASAARRAAAS